MTPLDETTLPKPILAQVRAILARDADADRMALVWPDPITPAKRVQQVDGVALRFVWCASELALRERLVANRGAPGAAPKADPEADPGADPEADPEVVLEAAAGETEQAAGDPRLVLLTPLDERRLSRDLLARLWGHAPKRISPWRTLEQLLRLREIDPRLTTKEYRWISACLLEHYDRYRDRVQFGEVLDFDLAWRALAMALLDLDGEGLDLDMLLDWSQRPDAAARIAALPEPMAQHLEDWLRPRLGEQVQVVLALWRNGQAGGMLAIGVVCSLLYGRERQPSDRQSSRSALAILLQARGRFSERLLGGAAIPEPLLARFGTAAVSHLERAPGLGTGQRAAAGGSRSATSSCAAC